MKLEHDITALGVNYQKPEVSIEAYTVHMPTYNISRLVSCEVYVKESKGKDTLVYLEVKVYGELTLSNILDACIAQFTKDKKG